jgi:homoserine O-acetyltransferase
VGKHPVTGKKGWWDTMVGSGRPLDTDKYFIICANVLGGCMGSFGPKAVNNETGKPYNLDFPVITIADMVRAQKLLIDQLGVERLFSVIGASMGGMLALQWAQLYPKLIDAVIPIATAARHTAQNIAFHEIGRQSIIADPGWEEGNYIQKEAFPAKGLAVARMTAHVTYLSEEGLHRKFGRNLQDRNNVTFGFEADFQVESYLRHQGMSFVERFDPNSYLYITRAMDYFDMAADVGGHLGDAFKDAEAEFCVVSFSSDWLFPTEEVRTVVHALSASGVGVSFVEIPTDKGHDAFLLEEPAFENAIKGFLEGVASRR